jgi:hypothetical protein
VEKLSDSQAVALVMAHLKKRIQTSLVTLPIVLLILRLHKPYVRVPPSAPARSDALSPVLPIGSGGGEVPVCLVV